MVLKINLINHMNSLYIFFCSFTSESLRNKILRNLIKVCSRWLNPLEQNTDKTRIVMWSWFCLCLFCSHFLYVKPLHKIKREQPDNICMSSSSTSICIFEAISFMHVIIISLGHGKYPFWCFCKNGKNWQIHVAPPGLL